MTPRERAVAAATTFNANNPAHFPGRPLFEGLVENAVVAAEVAVAETVVDSLTDQQREELFRLYCRGCGRKDPRCNCERDPVDE